MNRLLIVLIFFGGLLMGGCTKETPRPAAAPAVNASVCTPHYSVDNIGQLIKDASPALYREITQPSDRAQTGTEVKIIHGSIYAIGPPPLNDPVCAKNCTTCICCIQVTSDKEISLNGGGVVNDVENNAIEYSEGEENFNAANSYEGYKYFILANDNPTAVEIKSATATLSDDNQFVSIHIEK
jgi:hypothetical protein